MLLKGKQAAWQFTSRVSKIFMPCQIQQVSSVTADHGDPCYIVTPKRQLHSLEEVSPGTSRCDTALVGAVAKGHMGRGAPWSARQTQPEKGMLGLSVKCCYPRRACRGTRHGGEQRWWLCDQYIPRDSGMQETALGKQTAHIREAQKCTFWFSTQNKFDFRAV